MARKSRAKVGGRRKVDNAQSRSEPARAATLVVVPRLSASSVGRRLNEIAKRTEPGGRAPWRAPRGRRPLILDGAVRRQVLDSVRLGAYLWVAANAAGITERTLMYWLQKGREGIEPYVQFFQEIEQSLAFARLSAETRVQRDNPLAWLRVGPGRERPGRPGWTEEVQRVEVTGKDGEPIKVDLRLSDDELREVAKLAGDVGLLGAGEAPADPSD